MKQALRIPPRSAPTPRRQRGISLLEMMVGIVIGLVCVLIIVQTLSVWESRKRTVASGTDAQISGTLGAFLLDRDLRLAGYGFGLATAQIMECDVIATKTGRSGGADFRFPFRPVQITKGTGAASDTVSVLYGNSSYFVSSQPLLATTATAAATTKRLKSREGFQLGDKVVVTGNDPVDCQLVEVTGQTLTEDTTIEHEAGKIYTTLTGAAKTASMNPTGGTGTTFTTGRVYNLGPTPARVVWTVANGSLTHYNFIDDGDSTKAVGVASDVVTLKAQYGVDTSGNGKVESGEWYDTLPLTANWTQVVAVRFGLLLRSRQQERATSNVTATAPSWAGGAFVMANLDGSSGTASAASADWRNYRYRVYENVVPLRNMIWGTAQ